MERKSIVKALLFFLVLSLPSFAFQKLTSTEMRENSIRINALEIREMDVQKIEAPKEVTVVLDARALNFDFDKSNVKDEYIPILEQLKAFILHNNYVVSIIGHTDSKGSNAYNFKLAQRRADSVKAKLIELGLEEGRIVETLSRGEEEPVASNDTAEGRFTNRRVEFYMVQAENAQ